MWSPVERPVSNVATDPNGHTAGQHDRRLSWSELKRRKPDARSLTATSGNVILNCGSAAPASDQLPKFE
jgi:hypothetical protein